MLRSCPVAKYWQTVHAKQFNSCLSLIKDKQQKKNQIECMFSDRFRWAKNCRPTLTVRSFVKWIVSALFLSYFFSIYIFITSRRTESYVNLIFFCFVCFLLLWKWMNETEQTPRKKERKKYNNNNNKNNLHEIFSRSCV